MFYMDVFKRPFLYLAFSDVFVFVLNVTVYSAVNGIWQRFGINKEQLIFLSYFWKYPLCMNTGTFKIEEAMVCGVEERVKHYLRGN